MKGSNLGGRRGEHYGLVRSLSYIFQQILLPSKVSERNSKLHDICIWSPFHQSRTKRQTVRVVTLLDINLDALWEFSHLLLGCFGSVHVNQLTDSGFKNQKNQSKLIPLIPLYLMQVLKTWLIFFWQGVLAYLPLRLRLSFPGSISHHHCYLCRRSEKAIHWLWWQEYGKWWNHKFPFIFLNNFNWYGQSDLFQIFIFKAPCHQHDFWSIFG